MAKKGRFRRYFFTGLFTILPILITILALTWFWNSISSKLGIIPQKFFPYRPELLLPLQIAILLTIIIAITFIGFIATRVIGRTLVNYFDSLLIKIPLLSSIYKPIKQIMTALTMSSNKAFRQVVLLEYPRKGLQAFGFVTGDFIYNDRKKMIMVYIPTAPNPTSGVLIACKKEDLQVLDLSVEEGLKLVISAGTISPKKISGKKILKSK